MKNNMNIIELAVKNLAVKIIVDISAEEYINSLNILINSKEWIEQSPANQQRFSRYLGELWNARNKAW
jgi:hypothetical protein